MAAVVPDPLSSAPGAQGFEGTDSAPDRIQDLGVDALDDEGELGRLDHTRCEIAGGGEGRS